MAATLSEFEELEVKKQFAEKLFDFARQGLERAQLSAMGQSIYLTVFLPPSLPQQYMYPERWTVFLIIALTALMTWISGPAGSPGLNFTTSISLLCAAASSS